MYSTMYSTSAVTAQHVRHCKIVPQLCEFVPSTCAVSIHGPLSLLSLLVMLNKQLTRTQVGMWQRVSSSATIVRLDSRERKELEQLASRGLGTPHFPFASAAWLMVRAQTCMLQAGGSTAQQNFVLEAGTAARGGAEMCCSWVWATPGRAAMLRVLTTQTGSRCETGSPP